MKNVSSMLRAVITPDLINAACLEFREQLMRRIERKGSQLLISRHEILGVVTEEYTELSDAVHSSQIAHVRSECWDVAIAGAIGAMSIDGGVEW